MANIREIQSRINSVKDTMKITNAMYMISSSKMTHARKKLADTEPYFYALQGEISRILRHVPDLEHPFFDMREKIPAEERKIGTIVVTADKGLAGAYNHNVVKLAEEILARPGQHKLYIVGELGRHYFKKHGVEIENSFQYTVQKPTMHRARALDKIRLFILVFLLYSLDYTIPLPRDRGSAGYMFLTSFPAFQPMASCSCSSRLS